MKKVIIVGCGPSGITTGIFAKNKGNKVLILERNDKPLKKLLMTGNGKCNYFNERYSTNNYYSEDINIVDKIISDKNINEAKSFFDSLGIIPKIKNGCLYPFSNQATTIKNVLIKEALNRGVEIEYNSLVTNIYKEKNKFIVECENNKYEADYLVLSTGSFAYPKTGSDGFGYKFLKEFNHTIIKPLPALVQLTSNLSYLNEWNGVRTDVELELFENNKYIMREEGEVQLTKYGISGICTFNLSNYVTRGLDKGFNEEIRINFVPFIETLITPWMDTYSKNNPSKNITELLEGFLNYKLVKIILKEAEIKEDIFYKDLNNEKKLLLCKTLRSFKVPITGSMGFDNSQICNGGVKLTEIDYNTMESKLVNNLYITGELLDMNGNCGGYNLTTCWISGVLAGKRIGEDNA